MSYRGAQNTPSYASRLVKMLCVGAGCDAGKSLASPAAVALLQVAIAMFLLRWYCWCRNWSTAPPVASQPASDYS